MLLEPCHHHIIFIFNWTLPFLYLTLIYWIRFIFHSQFKHISCSLLWYLYYLNHILVIRITNMVTFYVMIHYYVIHCYKNSGLYCCAARTSRILWQMALTLGFTSVLSCRWCRIRLPPPSISIGQYRFAANKFHIWPIH